MLPGLCHMTTKQLTVGDLYPEYSKEELIEAEANLRRFAAILLRVYERTKAEGVAWGAQSEHEEFEEEPIDGIF